MFSPEIVCSEEFLDMPASSRDLYFQLGMHADDDGFVQPKMIMRTIGSSTDDLKVLITKRFILPFESGVVVIKHWLIHNMIRLDRYKNTRFLEEKSHLFVKENKAYTDDFNNGKPLLATKWQPNGNHSAPQVRLGKDNNTDENSNFPLKEEEDWIDIDFKSPLNKRCKHEQGMWVVIDKNAKKHFYHNKKFYEYKKVN